MERGFAPRGDEGELEDPEDEGELEDPEDEGELEDPEDEGGRGLGLREDAGGRELLRVERGLGMHGCPATVI